MYVYVCDVHVCVCICVHMCILMCICVYVCAYTCYFFFFFFAVIEYLAEASWEGREGEGFLSFGLFLCILCFDFFFF